MKTPPSFVGKARIVAGINDKVLWSESHAGTVDLSATLTPGSFYPSELGAAIAVAMNTESASTGKNNAYSVTFSPETCKYTVSRSSGPATFRLRKTSSDADNVWTGGVVDSDGDALLTGERGPDNLGFTLDGTPPSYGDAFESSEQAARTWTPTGGNPFNSDTEDKGDPVISVQRSLSGRVSAVRFGSWKTRRDGSFGFDRRSRSVSFELLNRTDATSFRDWFAGPVGVEEFRLYSDRSASDYSRYTFSPDTAAALSLGARLSGYEYWTIALDMWGVA